MKYNSTNSLLIVNLQLFADDSKTEKATPKKKQDARKKGQVLQSKEVNTALVLLFVFLSIKMLGGYMYSVLQNFSIRILEEYPQKSDVFTLPVLTKLFYECVICIGKMLAPILAVSLLTGLAVSYSQVGVIFTTETLMVKLERINPLSGLKRIFSMRSLAELFKSILKITFIGYVAYSYIKGETANMLSLMAMEPLASASYIASVSINTAIRISFSLLFIALLDYVYQWWDYEKSLKMTKQEIKEEYKQMEGNPEVKGKIKQKQRQLSMRRMMAEVPKADVVITNPTHFAVAVKYDASKGEAPIVLAKGQDYVAQRIKEIARENKVEIVENRPLARQLFASVEIGEAIPQEMYQAVAEVLAFVYSLKK